MNQPRKPLDGIRVLSSEIQVAGPYCTMMLADHGAQVVKVEQPKSGDTARRGAPLVKNEQGQQQSGYFLRFNRNKRSLTLNLKSDAGRQIFRDLAQQSDVLVENFRPGLLEELGLGYKDLRQLNPGLIYASISGFGTMEEYQGPYSGRPAYDIVAQAMGGLMTTCGQAGGPPTWLGVALGDIVSGMQAAYAIMLALYDRAQTGRGISIDAFAPQIWAFRSAGVDVLEEVAKFRAARRIWARLMRERFGAQNPEAMKLKIFAYTLGGNLVAQQPLNNIARVAIETLAAVLGGVQTIATSSYDEAYGLPTEEAATVALRTQQIVAHEAGVTGTVDPLGGWNARFKTSEV